MASRIEEIIEEIEEYIGDCKFQTFSNQKIIVDKDEIDSLLSELKTNTPDEIRKYQKIISNKEAIMADAQAKADSIIAEAQIQTNELVSEHQIMQQAYAQANEIVAIATKQAQEIMDKATTDANEIRQSAITYTDDMMRTIEGVLANALETSKTNYDSLIRDLSESQRVVTTNRRELNGQSPAPAQAEVNLEDEISTI
jgi:cell division septum initiation protein DivIVA